MARKVKKEQEIKMVEPEIMKPEVVEPEVKVIEPKVIESPIDKKVPVDLCICGSGKQPHECCVKKYIR